MILLLLSNVIEKSCDYMITALKVWIVNKLHVHHMNEVDAIMVLKMYVCYIWFHDIMYSCICAPYRICCMCSMWVKNDGIIVIICAYITQSFTPRQHRVMIWIHMSSVATTPKVWVIGRGGLHLRKFLTHRLSPVTIGWAIWFFGIGPRGHAKGNVRRSRLNNGGGPVEGKNLHAA
jgi:hypothetical protein